MWRRLEKIKQKSEVGALIALTSDSPRGLPSGAALLPLPARAAQTVPYKEKDDIMGNIQDLDARIAAAKARQAGITITPGQIESGTDAASNLVGSTRPDGREMVNVPSARTREQILDQKMNARTQHGPSVTEIRTADTSLLPKSDGSAGSADLPLERRWLG